MIRIDLLPPRYRAWRQKETKSAVFLVTLAAVAAVLLAWQAALQAERAAGAQRIAALRQASGQYKLVHDHVRRLEREEKALAARLSVLAPLIGADDAALKVFASFRRRFPERVCIASLRTEAGGRVSLRGTAQSYGDVARLLTWLQEEQYTGVKLERADLDEKGGRVQYHIQFGVRGASGS
ncbi:MAG: PilN domain-containing protein [Bacillota bacterium]|nr:PilN domain-containing protein [Bacillota bacterium]